MLAGAQTAGAAALACPARTAHGPLTSVELSDGPPAEEAFLAPDRSIESKTGLTNRWKLDPSPRGYWTRCRYGKTVVDLKLPLTIRQCAIRYDAAQKVLRDGRQPACD